ncbi:Npun_F0494 family protein [Thermocoleostomius sinensis]|jgi:hypothetical protein|uniref:Uncharacterized protein n=1 Tax=Thermocoleostomius sinensis A174 TaxID=2016057 RepID=A0A9E8ZDT6_9CYAN|nr:Npun_F0494 family protein [Thermocoleostomius sinensis]WAL59385.1 hypothetical protein OXH18_19750 [Thermocoleostomius sinensis A174]
MTQTPKLTQPIRYTSTTMERAERALRCAPFQLLLFRTMRHQSVELRTIAGKMGLQVGYTTRAMSELAVENELLWLIQVGLLRREVDGQGITSSFRLTPLGHQLVEKWQQSDIPPASRRDRLVNALNRWLRLPSWLQ